MVGIEATPIKVRDKTLDINSQVNIFITVKMFYLLIQFPLINFEKEKTSILKYLINPTDVTKNSASIPILTIKHSKEAWLKQSGYCCWMVYNCQNKLLKVVLEKQGSFIDKYNYFIDMPLPDPPTNKECRRHEFILGIQSRQHLNKKSCRSIVSDSLETTLRRGLT